MDFFLFILHYLVCDVGMISASDQETEDLPTLTVQLSGRDTLWGKTRAMFLQTEHLNYDWVLKADDDTFILMENLKAMLSHFNSSSALLAGALWRCRGNRECQDWEDNTRSEQLFMSGGAGYVLSREAVRRFREGQETSCRPGDLGPEDVEMSRCLQRLGVSFIDTRDSQGR